MKTTAVSTSLAASLLLLSACSDATSSASDAEDDYPSGPVSMYAGAGTGSGFDTTLRSVVESLEKEASSTSSSRWRTWTARSVARSWPR